MNERLEALKAVKFEKQAPAKTFEPMEEGDYIGKIVGIGVNLDVERKDKNTGDTRLQNEITFVIGVGEETILSRPFNYKNSDQGNLIKAMKLILKNNNLTQDELGDMMIDMTDFLLSLVNKEVAIDVVHNTVGDKTYANVDIIKLRAGDVSETEDDFEISPNLADIFTGYVGAVDEVIEEEEEK